MLALTGSLPTHSSPHHHHIPSSDKLPTHSSLHALPNPLSPLPTRSPHTPHTHSQHTPPTTHTSLLPPTGVAALVHGLASNTHLIYLSLSSVRMGDVGATALAAALKDQNDFVISLRETHMSTGRPGLAPLTMAPPTMALLAMALHTNMALLTTAGRAWSQLF